MAVFRPSSRPVSRPVPRSASRPTLPQRLRRRLARVRWRPVVGLAGFSLVFSGALVAYLFGAEDHFFSRLFSAFVVVFGLLAFTALAAVPFVSWAAANWFGLGWAAASGPGSRGRRAGAGADAPLASPPRRTNVPARAPAPEPYS